MTESDTLILTETQQFAEDVLKGLSAEKKYLSSKYFYDEAGSRLFQSIMHLPEYYLTDCEFEIFSMQTANILEAFDPGKEGFDLVEFGAGDGLKTKLLIRHFIDNDIDFNYVPIDISASALEDLKESLLNEYSSISIKSINDDYFTALKRLSMESQRMKVALFLGSNIGNFNIGEALNFLKKLYQGFSPGDKLLTGFDLKKNPYVILRAYDDEQGITREFNLNLLKRMNRELGAEFNIDHFEHYPLYDPESGAAKSYIVSMKEQSVYIGALDREFEFGRWELIHTEISQKYDYEMIDSLAAGSGFELIKNFHDCRYFFVDSLWTKK